MVLIDAVVRLLPGVIGAAASLAEESFEAGLLEYPHYTRPRDWEGRAIPEVLLSGDHKRIAEWRRAEAERLTRERRPDLWARTRKALRAALSSRSRAAGEAIRDLPEASRACLRGRGSVRCSPALASLRPYGARSLTP